MTPTCCRALLLGVVCVTAWAAPALAQQQPGHQNNVGGIYSCTDGKGRRHTSDRPITECQDREHRLLNTDGSVRKVLPPAMSPSDRADQDARDQKAAQALVARQDAARRDRNLMLRYPNEAVHEAARLKALEDVNASIAASEGRLGVLVEERKALTQEAADPAKQPPTGRLRYQIATNQTAIQAQSEVVKNQQAELKRLEVRYDNELALLKRLWAGAAPGSVGDASLSVNKTPTP